MNTLRTAAVAAACLATVALTAPAAVSDPPHQVDPAQLQPPLNPNFAPWSCFEAGTGITCKGGYEASYHEPIGLTCDGKEVWISGTAREFMTRWHDAEGLATRTRVHLDFPADVFSLSADGSGPTLTIKGHFNRHYVYPVPGDLATRVMTEVGAIYVANQRGQGNVLHDTGTVTFEPGADFEEIAVMHGVHQVYDGTVDVDQLICDELT
ncbi:hypothetical protein CFI00_13560 [Nocardioides sp. S5]|uniref:hypothetical protein n=1 Tax=Nocardioides sp. S5 TaxID=2017486 RepID=UPI001A8C3C73|nr:hypothetical protein [Nocardioides sp. S5]QSR31511.1 hypothetical protein CFI00_13560 [Nocardioides sp. S5]